jgi:hypothetical protein
MVPFSFVLCAATFSAFLSNPLGGIGRLPALSSEIARRHAIGIEMVRLDGHIDGTEPHFPLAPQPIIDDLQHRKWPVVLRASGTRLGCSRFTPKNPEAVDPRILPGQRPAQENPFGNGFDAKIGNPLRQFHLRWYRIALFTASRRNQDRNQKSNKQPPNKDSVFHRPSISAIRRRTVCSAVPPDPFRALIDCRTVRHWNTSFSKHLSNLLKSRRVSQVSSFPFRMQNETIRPTMPWASRNGTPFITRYSAKSVAVANPPPASASIRSRL